MKKYISAAVAFFYKNKKSAVFVFCLAVLTGMTVFFVCPAGDAAAQTLWDDQIGMDEVGDAFNESGGEPTDIRAVTINVIKVFLTFVGIILFIYIFAAGYKWMTAGGEAEKVNTARRQITQAIIGIIIILAAYMLTVFVSNSVFEAVSGN